jgi:hypothetical protein
MFTNLKKSYNFLSFMPGQTKMGSKWSALIKKITLKATHALLNDNFVSRDVKEQIEKLVRFLLYTTVSC